MKKMFLLMMCCLAVAFTACKPDRTITASADPVNGGTIQGTGTYENGESCTLTATPNNGFAFVNWTENGNEISTNNKYTFEATADRHFIAHFNETEPSAPNAAFLGNFSGKIYLNGVATAPQLQMLNMPDMPIDSMEFILTAEITEGETEKSVDVLFSINEEQYSTKGTVNGSTINFGILSYTYVEGPSTFDVNLNLTGSLSSSKNILNLSGPFDGTGNVTIEGFPLPLDLTATGTVTGSLTKQSN